jgi:C4-dicarboxylate-specific signal transduction histidine kinase
VRSRGGLSPEVVSIPARELGVSSFSHLIVYCAKCSVRTLHQFAIAKRRGKWEVLETPKLKRTKEELRRQSEQLEHRVAQRTAKLATSNEKLTHEIADRAVNSWLSSYACPCCLA